jgi:hypothetical protein
MMRSASVLGLLLAIIALFIMVVSLGTTADRTARAPTLSLDSLFEDPALVGLAPTEAKVFNTRNSVPARAALASTCEDPVDPCVDLREQIALLLKELGRTPAEFRREAFSAMEMATFFETELSAMAEAVFAEKERLMMASQDYAINFSAQPGLVCWWIPDDGGGGGVAGPPPSVKLLVWDPVVGYAQEAVLTTAERARWVMLYAGLHRSTTGDYPAAYFSRD